MAYLDQAEADQLYSTGGTAGVVIAALGWGALSNTEKQAYLEQASLRFNGLPWPDALDTEDKRKAATGDLEDVLDLAFLMYVRELVDSEGRLTRDLVEDEHGREQLTAFSDLPTDVAALLLPLFPSTVVVPLAPGPGETTAQAAERTARAALYTAQATAEPPTTAETNLQVGLAAQYQGQAALNTALAAGQGALTRLRGAKAQRLEAPETAAPMAIDGEGVTSTWWRYSFMAGSATEPLTGAAFAALGLRSDTPILPVLEWPSGARFVTLAVPVASPPLVRVFPLQTPAHIGLQTLYMARDAEPITVDGTPCYIWREGQPREYSTMGGGLYLEQAY